MRGDSVERGITSNSPFRINNISTTDQFTTVTVYLFHNSDSRYTKPLNTSNNINHVMYINSTLERADLVSLNILSLNCHSIRSQHKGVYFRVSLLNTMST